MAANPCEAGTGRQNGIPTYCAMQHHNVALLRYCVKSLFWINEITVSYRHRNLMLRCNISAPPRCGPSGILKTAQSLMRSGTDISSSAPGDRGWQTTGSGSRVHVENRRIDRCRRATAEADHHGQRDPAAVAARAAGRRESDVAVPAAGPVLLLDGHRAGWRLRTRVRAVVDKTSGHSRLLKSLSPCPLPQRKPKVPSGSRAGRPPATAGCRSTRPRSRGRPDTA